MAQGQLVSPNLDDRQWQDIVDEARALIPRYNSQWTDHNQTDLGITLMELFAWIVEGMIYRLNRVPDKSFMEFLNLLGITRDPAAPATVDLMYQLAPTALPVVLPKGNLSATQQTDLDTPILFETDEQVTLLSSNLVNSLYLHKLPASQYENVTTQLTSAPLSGFSKTLAVGEASTIGLGFDQATAQPILLKFRFRAPAKPGDYQVKWLFSQAAIIPSAWPAIPAPLDGTTTFTRDGSVSLTVPLTWTAQNPSTWPATTPTTPADAIGKSLFWIGVQVANLAAAPLTLEIDAILYNCAHASNALTVAGPEFLGTSNGKPFQYFDLANVPLFKRPGATNLYDHLTIQVRQTLIGGTFGPWTTWTQVDDFPAGAGAFYRVDPVMGRINFGNHDAIVSPDGHGSIPPSEAEIQALTYRYVVGGAIGNVSANSVTVLRSPVPGLVSVMNPGAAANGADEETIADTKRRGPQALRNRYRAVTSEDYEYLASESSTDVQKVRCLEPRLVTTYDKVFNALLQPGDPWTFAGLNRDAGNVNVIVIPGAPLSNPTPVPTLELLAEVADYLEERRSVAAALQVTGPKYLPIQVTCDIKVWQKAVDTGLVPDPAVSPDVKDTAIARIKQFLHPTLGNSDGKGWEVGEDQTIAPLFEFIKPASEVGFIAKLEIQALVPLYTPPIRLYPSGPAVWIKFADYEMVCSAAVQNVNVAKI